MTASKPRRIPRAGKRAEFWEQAIASAPSGREALDALMDWLRGELKHIERTRPQEADGLRRHLARKWAPDVRALATSHPAPSERTSEPVPPPSRHRPLQPVEAGRLERAEKIHREPGPLTGLRGGQRFPEARP